VYLPTWLIGGGASEVERGGVCGVWLVVDTDRRGTPGAIVRLKPSVPPCLRGDKRQRHRALTAARGVAGGACIIGFPAKELISDETPNPHQSQNQTPKNAQILNQTGFQRPQAVPDPLETRFRQDFQHADTIPAEEAGTETQA